MGLFRNKQKKEENNIQFVKLLTENGNGTYVWDGKLFHSDIARACIRPMAKAIGKMPAKHIREMDGKIKVNPEPYMRILLSEPNPMMSMQMVLEKMTNQFALNNNAYAVIYRDEFGVPMSIVPIPAVSAEVKYIDGQMCFKFTYQNGRQDTFLYSDIIHIRNDYSTNDVFGTPNSGAITELMELIGTSDKSIISAVKNSNAIQWLLKFQTALNPADVKKRVKEFVDNFMSVKTNTFGAAGVNSTVDAVRMEPKDYVPNSAITTRIVDRLYAFFNTNEKIVKSTANEDEWNAYYELVIEPLAIQFSKEFTRKLFTARERGCGNKIVFEASNLSCASLNTKLALVAMVDRGALTPNEWRATMNMAPVEGGDVPLRRKDTGVVSEGGGSD